ncbi:MAG: RrF2 family transcriptional regulator [Calditrichia bacterium]
MRLTLYSDYSLRVLLYLALNFDKPATIKEIATSYDISKNHLMKVASGLKQAGYVKAIRGRSGGLLLARKPTEINIGAVIRTTEEDFKIVECFDPETNTCCIAPNCRLQNILNEAIQAFIAVLDKYSLHDLTKTETLLRKSLGIEIKANQ